MSVLETKLLTKHYGKARGIENVSINIEKGEIFGFIGPNGAGKSTTIRTLLGFLKPSGGSARIFGLDCFSRGREIKARLGYVPAEVSYYGDMRVKELLEYSAAFYGKSSNGSESKKGRINELCEIFGVEIDKRMDSLSYGNKKKVAIVQALLHEPELLIFDEPTGGLDPLVQNSFFEVLRKEKSKGTTIFFSSHVLSEVEKMCDRVAIIKEGRILRTESIEKLRGNRYRKLKLDHTPDSKPDVSGLPGVTSLRSGSGYTEFMYNGDINALLGALALTRLDNVCIEEPSLEEIFMHYYSKGE
ncbi:MAG TPA: ABC transporter ATP-binding protein [Clostridia bacterium]|nr:ABC transporter ATP-binding protein [Clostridia bacterium]